MVVDLDFPLVIVFSPRGMSTRQLVLISRSGRFMLRNGFFATRSSCILRSQANTNEDNEFGAEIYIGNE